MKAYYENSYGTFKHEYGSVPRNTRSCFLNIFPQLIVHAPYYIKSECDPPFEFDICLWLHNILPTYQYTIGKQVQNKSFMLKL